MHQSTGTALALNHLHVMRSLALLYLRKILMISTQRISLIAIWAGYAGIKKHGA